MHGNKRINLIIKLLHVIKFYIEFCFSCKINFFDHWTLKLVPWEALGRRVCLLSASHQHWFS